MILKFLLLIMAFRHSQQTFSLFPVDKVVNQQAKYRFQFFNYISQIPANTNLVLDFSSSLIVPPVGALTVCETVSMMGTTTTLSSCSCDANKLCTMTISTAISQFTSFTMNIGLLTNPGWIEPSQQVQGSIQTSPNPISNTIYITGDKYSPGTITLSSLAQASLKVGFYNDYTINIKLNNAIPAQGQIKVKVLAGTDSSDMKWSDPAAIDVKVYDNAVNSNVQITKKLETGATSYIITNANTFLQSQIVAEASKTIQIVCKTIRNPIKMAKSSTSMEINTMNKDEKMIDQITSGIQGTSSEPVSITFISIQVMTESTVGKANKLRFKIQPLSEFQPGGYLLIQFPAEFTLGTVVCQSIFGLDTEQQKVGSCTKNGQDVRTVNVYYPDKSVSIQYDVEGFTNPLTTKPTSSFLFKTYDSGGLLLSSNTASVASQFTATKNTLSITKAVRSSNNADSDTDLTIGFTITTKIAKGSLVLIKLKKIFIVNKTGSFTCKKIVQNVKSTITCTQSTEDSDYFTLQITEFCAISESYCNANSQMELEITTGLKNPLWVQNTLTNDALIVGTYTTDNYVIDEGQSQLAPVLDPVSFTDMTFARSVSDVGGQQTQWTMTIDGLQYGALKTSNGNIIVYFPKLLLGKIDSLNPVCTVTIGGTDFTTDCTITYYAQTAQQAKDEPIKSVHQIQFGNICQTASNCASMSQQMTLKVTKIRNYLESVVVTPTSSNYFGIRVNNIANTQSLQFMQSSKNTYNKITKSQFHAFSVATTNTITGKLDSYTFTLNPNQEFPETGYMYLTMAAENLLSSNVACSVSVDGNQGVCTVDSANKRMRINFEQLISAGTVTQTVFTTTSKVIQVVVSNVNNPYSTKQSSDLLIESFTNGNNAMQYHSTTVTMTTANAFQSQSITRSVTTVSSAVELTLTFQITNIITNNNNYVELKIAKDQVAIANKDGLKIDSLKPTASQNVAYTVVSDTSDFLTIKFDLIHCPCITFSQEISFKIYNGLTNPISTKLPSNDNQLTTKTSDNYLQDQSSFKFQPSISAGTLTSITVTPNVAINNLVIFSLVEYTMNIVIKNPIPIDGIIHINVPDNILYHSSSGNIKVTLTDSSTQLALSTSSKYTTNTNFNFLKQVIVKEMCKASNGCNAGTSVNIKIHDSLYSSYSNIDLSNYDQLQIQSFDASGNIIDGGLKSANVFNANKLSSLTTTTFTRSSQIPGDKTVYVEISITLSSMILEAYSIIRVTLPNDQIQLIDNLNTNLPKCQIYVSSTLQSSVTPCPIITHDSTQTVIDINEFCSNSKKYCADNSVLKFRISNIQNGMVIKSALTSDILINIYKTSISKQQFQEINNNDNKRFTPELSASQFQSLQVSLDNYIANIDSHLLLQFSLISPVVQNGYFVIDISEQDFLLNTNQKCQIAQGHVLTDPYIDYKDNSCTVTTYSTNGQTYYKQIKLASTFTSAVAAKDTKIIIKITGRNRYYSKTNSNSLVLKSQSSNSEDISTQTVLLNTINALTIYTMDTVSIVRTIGTLGTSIDLTFEFSLAIRLLQSSTIFIRIPKNEQVIANTKSLNSLQCYLQLPKQMDLSCTKSEDSYAIEIRFDQQFCGGNCAANTNIKVVLRTHILGNPDAVLNVKNNANYKPLEIQGYYQNTNQMIFKSKLGLQISPELVIPQLKNVQIQRDSGIIQKSSVKMYFQFQVVNEVATTDKIQIIFPDKTIYTNDYNSQIPVQIHKVDNLVSKTQGTQITSGNVAVYYAQDSKSKYYITNIEISNYCATKCAADTTIYLQMSLFSNPNYVEQGINDKMYTISTVNQNSQYVNQKKVSSKYVIENLYGLQIADASVVRSSQTPDAATTLTVKFNNPTFKILANSYVNLLVPITQFNKIPSVNQLTCKQKTGTVINNCYMNDYTNNNNQYLNITFQEYCSSSSVDCNTNQNMEFTIEGLKNGLYQPAQSSTNTIMIQLLESYLNLYAQVEQLYPSPNIEGSVMMSDLVISRDNNVAGNDIVLDIKFKLLQNLQTNSKIYVQLPEYAFYNRYNLADQKCMDINNRVLSSKFVENVYLDKDLKSQSNRLLYKYIQEVQINDLCSQMILCSKDTTVQIKINLRNQISIANYFTNAKFTVLLLDQSQIQQSQGYLANTLSATTAGLFQSPTFTSSNDKVKATNVNLCLKTTLTNTFSSIDYQGKVQITIPSQLLSSKVLTVTANIQEISSLVLNPTYDSNNLITINYSQSEDDLSLKTLNVCINGITNPDSNLKTDSFILLSSEYIQKVSSVTTIDNSQAGVQYQVTTLGTITVSKFTRDQDSISANSQLTLEFQIENEVIQGSVFVLNVKDSNQMEFNSETLECKDTTTNSVITCSKDTTSITFDSFCKSSKCNAGSIYKIQVTKGLKNVDYVKSKTSLENDKNYFKLYSRLPNTGYVDSAETILVTPYMKNGVVQLTKFTRSENTIFKRTTLDLHVTSQSKIFQSSVLALQLPTNFLEDDVSNPDSIYCFKLTTNDYQIIQQISCNVVKYTNSIYNEVEIVRLKDICSQADCGSNYQLAVRIERIRNVGYYKPIDTLLDNFINIKFQASSGNNQYDDIDIIAIKQQSKFSDLTKQGLLIMEMRMNDPNPNTKTQMVVKIRNNVGTYQKSRLQITFVDGFTIDASKYKVRIVSPYSNQGSCSSQNEVLKINDIFNQYINYGTFMIIIDDITTPKVAKEYQGFKMKLDTFDNNLITDSESITTNKDVKLSIFNRLPDKDCDGQCLTCGPKSDNCLSCYNPSKFPLFDYKNKQCTDKCKDGQYLQENPSIVTSILPTYTCESCDIECKQCWGPSANQCTSCEPNKVFSDGGCIDTNECPFTSKVINGKCQLQDDNQCKNNCATCGPSKSFCYSCKAGYVYESNTGKCILSTQDGSGNDNTKCTLAGYYVDSTTKECKKCKLECKTCNNKDTCLTCNTFFGNYYQHEGKCIEQCPTQYFSTQDRICQKCISNCDNCLDSTSCYNCKKPYKLVQTTSKCESDCPANFYYNSQFNLCQSHECSNKKCYDCDKKDTSICTQCSKNTLYEVLFNNQCYTPTEACKIQKYQDNVFNTRIQVCQQCHLSDCQKCGLTDDQLFQKCEACSSGKYLYKGQCYTRCPTGLQHSVNRDNSADYVAKCLDVTCTDSKCKYCNPNSLKCYDCMKGYYLLDGGCVQSCGNSYVIKTNSDNVQYCHNIYVGNPGGYTIFVWTQLVLFSILIGVSVALKKSQVAITSSFIALFTVSEFFIRIGLFAHLYLNSVVSVYVIGINFICIFTNCGIGFLFKTLYISLYEQNLKTFSNFKFTYAKFYKFSIIGTIAFGVMFNEILVAALIKFPKAHFYRIRPFRNSLLKMQQASFILSLFQMIVNFYVIVVFVYVQDEMWYLSLTGVITNIVINVCFMIRKHVELKAINNHLIKPDENQQYEQVNKE